MGHNHTAKPLSRALRCLAHVCLSALLFCSMAAGCDKSDDDTTESSDDDDDGRSRKKKKKKKQKKKESKKGKATGSAATPTSASAKPTQAGPAQQFFAGPIPDGVKLTRKYTAYSPRYRMSIPKSWQTGGNRASTYMAMRADSKAAVFCDWGGLSAREVKQLSKRAPARGKDVVISDDVEVFEMGADKKFTVRAGTAKGTFFKKERGDLYWMDVAFEDGRRRGAVHCVMMVKAGADATVVNEAKGVMRAFVPPPGKPVITDRPTWLRK